MGSRRGRPGRALQRWQEFDAQCARGGEEPRPHLAHAGPHARTRTFSRSATISRSSNLPGYGFAKMARTEAARIAAMMRDYLDQSDRLVGLVMLVDARRGPEREELELATLATGRGVKLIAVATKSDKLRRSERAAALARFKPLGLEPILCSALSGEGMDDLRRRIIACARKARRADAPADDDGAADAPSR